MTTGDVKYTTSEQFTAILLDVALDLTLTLPGKKRYQRLVEAVKRVFPCDAAALLRLTSDGGLLPVAIEGLHPSLLNRTLDPSIHPRLNAILSSRHPVRFAADDPRPDPYDGLVEKEKDGHLHVHACMGASLYVDENLVGALTLDALKPGSFDHVPDQDIATFAALAAAAMKTAGLIDALESLAEKRGIVARTLVADALQREGGNLVGNSDPMEQLKREIDIVAKSDLSVLLQGETGTGKDLVARLLHARSSRSDRPLVYINCAALPESMAASELFGHRKGSFTGATEDRAGKFELADGGTLFLDEIGELPLSIQPVLLRALQSGEIQRIGADEPLKANVRVIAATNRDLPHEVKTGRFRPDLYHRISVFPIEVPPLRERGNDLRLLSEHILDRARARLGLQPLQLSADSLRMMKDYTWPGNVRELEHVLTRAALRAAQQESGSRITLTPDMFDLPTRMPAPPTQDLANSVLPVRSLRVEVDNFQRELIRHVLEEVGENWSKAAEKLEVDRGNLYRLGKRLGVK
ncbi:nitric oxide reductase transcriptional regulator NorR [bacterium]|nr:nitric oxide reductase transcriptional regulator NorR [bacterium]